MSRKASTCQEPGTIGLILLLIILHWQGAPPPPPYGHGGSTNQPAGNTAPIGGGLGILLALGAAYGGRKVYKEWKEQKEV
ncbi:MAG: hypothetical protein PHG67_03895 [Bacteroidales bacterium]|nr:hypothetical protein [Bacteroidales bacterium]